MCGSCEKDKYRIHCGDDLYGHQDYEGTHLLSLSLSFSLSLSLSLSELRHALTPSTDYTGDCISCDWRSLTAGEQYLEGCKGTSPGNAASCACPDEQEPIGCEGTNRGECVWKRCQAVPTNDENGIAVTVVYSSSTEEPPYDHNTRAIVTCDSSYYRVSPAHGTIYCKKGLWDFFSCKDVDECDENRSLCTTKDKGATCDNTVGGYVCKCTHDYWNTHCTTHNNDCSSGNEEMCKHGICTNLDRTTQDVPHYKCTCDDGWYIGDDGVSCSEKCIVGNCTSLLRLRIVSSLSLSHSHSHPHPGNHAGQFRKNCGQESSGECASCTNKGPNQYYVEGYTVNDGLTNNCKVKDCEKNCVNGFYKANCGTSGNETSEGICEPCTTDQNKGYWTAQGDFDGTCHSSTCTTSECGNGEYLDGCEGSSSGMCVLTFL